MLLLKHMTAYIDAAANLRLVVAKARDRDSHTFKVLVRSGRKTYESVRKLWLNTVIKSSFEFSFVKSMIYACFSTRGRASR